MVGRSAPTLLLTGGLAVPTTVRLVAPVGPIVWTDDPVTTDTPIKAVHVNELRRTIDATRRQVGLPSFAWTDDPVIARYSVIKAIHLVEMHQVLQDLWVAIGLGALPTWTAGSAPATERVIYASDVNDLRWWIEIAASTLDVSTTRVASRRADAPTGLVRAR